jgi:hypothetical protein
MKSLTKILFFAIPLLVCINVIAQPCTPDVNLPYTQGTFPESIPEANRNVAYSQVIQFKAPLDTNIFYRPLNTTVAVKIDSLRITDVLGLPPGMTYKCHNNACMVNGGQVGCIVLEGIPTQAGGYPLLVLTRTSGKLKGTPPFPDIPQVQNDTNTRYNLFVNWPTGIVQIVEAGSIQVYPNPAQSYVTVEGDFSGETQAVLAVYDIAGKSVKQIPLSKNTYKQDIAIADLPAGLYSFTIQSELGLISKRILVR